jgi:hypothetical protein
MAWTQSRNEAGELTGFVAIIARAKVQMPLEEWQELFCCRVATGIEDARDLGPEVDALRAAGAVVLEEGVLARILEDGQLCRETQRKLHNRRMAEGRRADREVGDAMERFYAQKRAEWAAEAAAEELERAEARAQRAAEEPARATALAGEALEDKENKENKERASAAVAARAMLAVRATWQQNIKK